jgi:Trk K+ transport system NAD-binding subunit
VVGLGRFGTTVVEELLERGTRVLGVDFDPRTVVADRLGIPVVYGDGDDPTLAQHLPLTVARWVVSTVRSHDVNMTLVTALRRGGYTGGIAVASEDPDDCAALTRAGADVTIRPLHVAAGPLLERIGAADRRRGLAP